MARAAIDHMLVRCCVSYFDLISCFESCWQLALSEHDIWLTEGNGKGQGKKSRINKSNCEAEKRVSQYALTPMHSLAECRLLRRRSSIIAYIIADYLTQFMTKRVIRDRRVIRPCMEEL